MYNKTTLILISIFLKLVTAHAQVVEWSNQQKLKSKTNYTKILGENATGLYVLRGKNGEMNNDIIIEKYKSNLALEKSEPLKQPYGSSIEKVLLQNEGLLVFSTQRNDSLPQTDIFCWKLNSQLQKTEQTQVITHIENGLFINNTEIYIKHSANKNSYALLYLTNGIEKNTTNIHLYGFDEAMKPAYNKIVSIPYPVDDIVISGFECDNEGNSHLLIDFPKNKDKKRKDKLRDYFLYSYYKSIDKILEYEIKQDSIFIGDIGLVVNDFKKVVNVAGIYSNENNTNASGTFVYSIDATTTLMQYTNYEPLSKTFVAKVTGMMLNETGSTITDLYIRKLIPRSDAGITIIAEKYYESRQSYTYYANGFPQTASRITFNFDEIIILSKNSEGKTQYNEFIKKAQSSMNDGGYYSSFVLLNTNDKLSFVYNANSNEESDVMITSINPLGKMDTKILIKAMSYYVQLMPIESKQINAASSIICTLKDRKFTLMKLTY